LLHFREKRPAQAVQCLVQAAEMAESFGNRDTRLGQTLGELAEMQRQQGESTLAERNFIRAIDFLEQLGTGARQALAPVITNLATLYFSQGNGVRAEGLYRRALEIWTSQLSANDRRLAPLYFNLATLRKTAGDSEEARQMFTVAARIAESAWGLEHPHTLRCRKALDELSQAAH
jgi:tetratricopeptide (TPR) repeat protein